MYVQNHDSPGKSLNSGTPSVLPGLTLGTFKSTGAGSIGCGLFALQGARADGWGSNLPGLESQYVGGGR